MKSVKQSKVDDMEIDSENPESAGAVSSTRLLGLCRNCKHWSTAQTLSVVRPDGGVMTGHGSRKLLHTSTLGWCAKIVGTMTAKREQYPDGKYDVVSPLDAIIADEPESENQWGSGGVNSPRFGPDFGCIHWEAKHPNY